MKKNKRIEAGPLILDFHFFTFSLFSLSYFFMTEYKEISSGIVITTKNNMNNLRPSCPSAGLPLDSLFSLRRVSSSVLHVCGAKIAKNHEIHHVFGKKVVGIENNSYLCTVTIK